MVNSFSVTLQTNAPGSVTLKGNFHPFAITIRGMQCYYYGEQPTPNMESNPLRERILILKLNIVL